MEGPLPKSYRTSAELVAAFGPFRSGDEVHRQLTWLAFFAARRSLPCWDLYSDGDQPHQTLEVVKRWLVRGEQPERWELFTRAVQPTYRGRQIIDCTYSDTRAVAVAVAALARFCQYGDPGKAEEALESAADAFCSSPLGDGDDFHQWLVTIALPAALQSRELSDEEQQVLRDYDAGEIAQEKERGGVRPLTNRGLFREFVELLFPQRCRHSTK